MSEPLRRLLGALLLAAGGLLLFTCGLCTTLFAGGFALATLAEGQLSGLSMVMTALVIGAPGIALGALLWWGGRRLRKRRETPADPTTFG